MCNFSVSLYDAHSAPTQSILDANIVPLTSAYINPYEPGTAYVSGQQFAVLAECHSVDAATEICEWRQSEYHLHGV